MTRSGKANPNRRGRQLVAAVLAPVLFVPALLSAQRPLRDQAVVQHASTDQVAWSLPDVNELVDRVFRRIVTQDKPGAIPMSDYTRRAFGRDETINAVRRFTGREIELTSSAFSAMNGWSAAHGLEVAACDSASVACPAPVNAVWIAIVRFERGDTPNELIVWYTTRFSARKDDQPVSNAYSFSERWFRVGGTWKYEGFISVKGA